MKIEFNAKAQKIVSEDEFRRKRFLLEQKEMTWKELLFQPLADLYSIPLWIGRAFTDTVNYWRGKEQPPEGYYYDRLDNRQHAPTYMDRETLESDLQFMEKKGLGKAFQAKSAAIARKAFDQSRDFSVLRETGQLVKYSEDAPVL